MKDLSLVEMVSEIGRDTRHLTADGKVRVRLTGNGLQERYPSGDVVDIDGNVVGMASSYTYGGNAFAVHTRPFAGYVRFDECEFVWMGSARV